MLTIVDRRSNHIKIGVKAITKKRIVLQRSKNEKAIKQPRIARKTRVLQIVSRIVNLRMFTRFLGF